MDSLIKGIIVYILLPDFSVSKGIIDDIYDKNLYNIHLLDGRTFCRGVKDIFKTEKVARAKKFLCYYKFRLKAGMIETLLDYEDNDIIELALDLWPEEFI